MAEAEAWSQPVGRLDELSAAACPDDPSRRTLAQIMDRSYGPVYRFARTQLDQHDAEDVTAEVFTIAFRRRRDLPPDPERAHAWVMSVARRVMWNQIRSLQRGRALVDRLSARPLTAPRADADSSSELDLIRRAIARLPRADREVIGLLAAGDLDRNGIAEALGCTSTAAGVRMHRARRRLRVALDDEDREVRRG